MGVLKDWSSIMESLTELDMFEALMMVVPRFEKEEEQVYLREAYVKPDFKKTFNKAFFEEEKERERQREPYMGLFAHDYLGFYNEAFQNSYEMLSEFEAPFIERGQMSYEFAESESVIDALFPLDKEETGQEAKAVFSLPEYFSEYGKAGYRDLTDKEDSSVAEGYNEAMEKGAVEKILGSAARETKDTRKHEIKVEMISHEGNGEEFDIDEMLEKMTERLCMMMAKGADGIYL